MPDSIDIQKPNFDNKLSEFINSAAENYKNFFAEKLITADKALLEALYEAPFVFAAHQLIDGEQRFVFANLAAQKLWELNWDKFTHMPSKYTAEPEQRNAREQLLKEVREKGFIDNYSGIRVSSTKKRFLISAARVWNILDDAKQIIGQAVKFNDYQYLDDSIGVVDYAPQYRQDFKALNQAWMEEYNFEIQPYDWDLLDHPEKILEKGGQIFCLVQQDRMIGTLSLLHHNAATIELSKMCIHNDFRGLAYARHLMQACFDYAKSKSYQEIVLHTSSKLTAAINMYKNYGFVEAPVPDYCSHYGDRCDRSFVFKLNS